MFEKTYSLSLNKDYVAHWGLAEAVRELIQNALDSDSPFVYAFKKTEDTYSLSLRSEFTTLSPKTLLLGSTSKAENKDAIGSFGEGYKIALLVLTRLGRPVSIANGDKSWVPSFKYNGKFEQELLVVTEASLPYKHTGLTFEVGGLTVDDCESIRDSCLQMQGNVGAVKSSYHGDILLERPGKLYVGGLFICNTDLDYGYNMHPSTIRLERDRQTVSSYDLKANTRDMWFLTQEFDRVAVMIDAGSPDVAYAEYSSNELVREACYRLFKTKNPGAVVAKDNEQLKEMVERGMTNVVVVHSAMYENVSTSKSYRSEGFVSVEPVCDVLARWLKKNKGKMQASAIVAFKELIVTSKNWKR